jgi:hypothetical protein
VWPPCAVFTRGLCCSCSCKVCLSQRLACSSERCVQPALAKHFSAYCLCCRVRVARAHPQRSSEQPVLPWRVLIRCEAGGVFERLQLRPQHLLAMTLGGWDAARVLQRRQEAALVSARAALQRCLGCWCSLSALCCTTRGLWPGGAGSPPQRGPVRSRTSPSIACRRLLPQKRVLKSHPCHSCPQARLPFCAMPWSVRGVLAARQVLPDTAALVLVSPVAASVIAHIQLALSIACAPSCTSLSPPAQLVCCPPP